MELIYKDIAYVRLTLGLDIFRLKVPLDYPYLPSLLDYLERRIPKLQRDRVYRYRIVHRHGSGFLLKKKGDF